MSKNRLLTNTSIQPTYECWFPLACLGLPLAESLDGSLPGEKVLAAFDAITRAPVVDLGIQFADAASRGHLRNLDGARVDLMPREMYEAPYFVSHKPIGSDDVLACLVPTIAPYDASRFCVFDAHAKQLFSKLMEPGLKIPRIPTGIKLKPVGTSLPYEIPMLGRTVSHSDLATFFRNFPDLAARLSKRLPWEMVNGRLGVPAVVANQAAKMQLGIEVDVRLGSLVPAIAVERALLMATGEFYGVADLTKGGYDYSGFNEATNRARALVSSTVQTVALSVPGVKGLRGAAWSCMVDVALNSPLLIDRQSIFVADRTSELSLDMNVDSVPLLLSDILGRMLRHFMPTLQWEY